MHFLTLQQDFDEDFMSFSYLESSFLNALAWWNEGLSKVPLQDRIWLALITIKMAGSKTPKSLLRNSTGSPIFSDFISKFSGVARFPTAGQGERRPWVRGWFHVKMYNILLWRMQISQKLDFFAEPFRFFSLLRFFSFFSAFLFSLPSTLYMLSSSLKSFNLYQWKTLERRHW